MNERSVNLYERALEKVAKRVALTQSKHILDLFSEEADRQRQFSLQAPGMHIDLAKQRIAQADLQALLELAQAVNVEQKRDAQLGGRLVNQTEARPVLHTALRRPAHEPLLVDGQDLMPQIDATRRRMRDFCEAVRQGRWTGALGHRIRHIVSIGIGGSQLGPVLACQALRADAASELSLHFLANIDPESWQHIRSGLDPKVTLVIVASKSWRTAETTRNAQAVRQWLLDCGIPTSGLAQHLVGVTANPAGARKFGLSDEGIFPFWDWVGGRFSLWSAIGLPVMLAVGAQRFEQMLAGAHAMDSHFAKTPLASNAPVLLALITFWNRLMHVGSSEPVVPYCDALARLPAYLQQLQMESNGKSVRMDGTAVSAQTVPVTWGEPGTDAQHSFFQALHQGTMTHPVEFILVIPSQLDPHRRDLGLLANAIAQSEALMRGKSLEQSLQELLDQGVDPERARQLAPHRVHPGNRPSTCILLERLDPFSLGALIALYEHKTATLGWLWQINSFDQWGVELGKKLADQTEQALAGEMPIPEGADPSTTDLIQRVRKMLDTRRS